MYLLIDAGNSRLKWLFGEHLPGIIEAVSYNSDWRLKLRRSWHLLPEPDAIVLSNVTNHEIEIAVEKLAAELWHKPIRTLTPPKHTQGILTVAYDKPEMLGSDRYLAMLGARSLSDDPLCVIGCGTALVLDAVDAEGTHLGGLILPGIRLAENALLHHTQKLVPMRWTANFLGTDTASCIGAGIHHALPTGVEQIIAELQKRHRKTFQRFVYGGDAQILFGKHPAYRIEPNLMFAGMLSYLAASAESH